jgi:hypothetical protein
MSKFSGKAIGIVAAAALMAWAIGYAVVAFQKSQKKFEAAKQEVGAAVRRGF